MGEWRDLAAQRDELEAAQGERAAWVEAHSEQLVELDGLERGLLARTAAAGRATELQRPEAITEVIGEPPVGLAGRERWRFAAGVLESYRAAGALTPTSTSPACPPVRSWATPSR